MVQQGCDWNARIVETEEAGPVVRAAASFAELTPAQRASFGLRARQLAESTLSITARNNERLDLWHSLGDLGRAFPSRQPDSHS